MTTLRPLSRILLLPLLLLLLQLLPDATVLATATPTPTLSTGNSTRPMVVKLWAVNDHKRWLGLGQETEATTQALAALVSRLFDDGGFSPGVEMVLVGQSTWVHGDPEPVASVTDQCPPSFSFGALQPTACEVSSQELLAAFHGWLAQQPATMVNGTAYNYDAAVLLTGHAFEQGRLLFIIIINDVFF